MTIPAAHLAALELQVGTLMAASQWQRALEEIRAAAVLYGESRDDLVRKVIRQALAEGHVSPIPMEPPEEP
jgi:hypothetical protein